MSEKAAKLLASRREAVVRVIPYTLQASSAKDLDVVVTPNFKVREFCSPRDSDNIFFPIGVELANGLQLMRDVLDRPIRITSAYRSPDYNKSIGGAKYSRHMSGCAADIQVDGITMLNLAGVAAMCGFQRIGISSNFVHIDTYPPTQKGLSIQGWHYGQSNAPDLNAILPAGMQWVDRIIETLRK